MQRTRLLKLSRLAVKFGLDVEALGGIGALADDDYVAGWISKMRSWDSRPASEWKQRIAALKWNTDLERMKASAVTTARKAKRPAATEQSDSGGAA
jgi:hypothetical protein